jgi:glycosyltransferase involved in cell wall biosynthesis
MGRIILFVIDSLDLGGAEKHLLGIAARLSERGFHPVVFALVRRGRLCARFEQAGIEIVEAPGASFLARFPRPIGRIVLLPLSMMSLRRLIRRIDPDVVHFFLPASYLAGGVSSLAAGERAYVMSRRSLNDYQRRHPVLARLEKRLHRRMAAVLGNSRAVVGQLAAEGVPTERLGLIYNGIDPSVFEELPARSEARRRLGIGEETVAMTMVANLIPYKGHMDLLEALSIVRDRLPGDWVMLCVGRDDGIGRSLRDKADVLGLASRVRWLGERNDVPEILHASDIGILSSHEEGFSNSILEGMAARLPMIVTSVGGNPEAVVNGVTGFVVPPRDPASMGNAILDLALAPDRRRLMGMAGRDRVVREFSLDACVGRYERLYNALCERKAVPVPEILAAGV